MTTPAHPVGTLGPLPELEPLREISPSHFTGLQACALREVWSAGRVPPLLPASPAARLGTVMHRLLEEAGRGLFAAGRSEQVAGRWEALVAATEEDMARNPLERHLLPLQASIPDFEVRQLQALSRATSLAAEVTSGPVSRAGGPGTSFGYELPVRTPDGRAVGKIDAVLPGEEGPILRDYKSGSIYEPSVGHDLTVKQAYADQLKLYAAIYAAMTGEWPSRLEVMPVAGEPEPVPFTRRECERLLQEGLDLLERTNRMITSGGTAAEREARLASPSPRACTYCPYRPACSPYAGAARTDDAAGRWPSDAWGEVADVRALGNSRLMLTLDADGTLVRIRGLDPDPARHPALAATQAGDRVGAFSLRPGGAPTSFTEGAFTVLYTLPVDAGKGRDTGTAPGDQPA